MDLETILEVGQTIIGFAAIAAAYLLHSPLGSGLDKRTTAVLTFLAGGKIQAAYDTATNLAESPDARRLAATNYLVQETKGTQLALTTAQADAALDWILQEYHQGQQLLENPKAIVPDVVQVVTSEISTLENPKTTEAIQS